VSGVPLSAAPLGVTVGAVRLGVVTIGQAPRTDLTPDLARWLPGVELVERGVLDGMGPAELAAMAPADGDHVLTTRLADGGSVEIGERQVQERLPALVAALEDEVDAVLLACTGPFAVLPHRKPLFVPDALIALGTAALATAVAPMDAPPASRSRGPAAARTDPPVPESAGAAAARTDPPVPESAGAAAARTDPPVPESAGPTRVGVICPLPEQQGFTVAKFSPRLGGQHVLTAAASPYTGSAEELAAAGIALRDAGAQLLALDCIGYTAAMRDAVAAETGLPVVLARSVAARLAAEVLDSIVPGRPA